MSSETTPEYDKSDHGLHPPHWPVTEGRLGVLGRTHKLFRSAEVVRDPESPALRDFHELLAHNFKPDEVEPLGVFQRELKSDDPYVKFLCTILRDPEKDNQVVSGAYGSAQTSAAYGSVQLASQDSILAVRFTLTEATHRATGVSQVADYMLLNEARRFCGSHDVPLTAIVAEAVEKSEGYWHATMQVAPRTRMSRLYVPVDGDVRSKVWKEIFYRIPSLEWNADGTPSEGEEIREHLMAAVAGCRREMPVERLQHILQSWWRSWYVRPEEDFNSEQAHQRHCATVKDTLQGEVLKPLEGYKMVYPIAPNVREALEQEGHSFQHLQLE